MAAQDFSLQRMVDKQVGRVLARGQRFDRFDQLRQRHFWSTYLFAYGAGNSISAGQYDVFKSTPGLQGQGYPSGVSLTLRETNWRNSSRVPDNQNFAISEVGVSLLRPPCVDGDALGGVPANAPTDGIWANLPAALQPLINPRRVIHPSDAANFLYGTVLEFGYLTNNVPLGLCADWSQSGGAYAQEQGTAQGLYTVAATNRMGANFEGIRDFGSGHRFADELFDARDTIGKSGRGRAGW